MESPYGTLWLIERDDGPYVIGHFEEDLNERIDLEEALMPRVFSSRDMDKSKSMLNLKWMGVEAVSDEQKPEIIELLRQAGYTKGITYYDGLGYYERLAKSMPA